MTSSHDRLTCSTFALTLCSAAGRSGQVLSDSAQADLLCRCGGLQRQNTRPHGEARQRRQRLAPLCFLKLSVKAVVILFVNFCMCSILCRPSRPEEGGGYSLCSLQTGD